MGWAAHRPAARGSRPVSDSVPRLPGARRRMMSSIDSNCVFCKIVAGRIPATVVYEDEHTLAFMDLGQVNPGHVLVVVKAHIENIYGLDDAEACALMRA